MRRIRDETLKMPATGVIELGGLAGLRAPLSDGAWRAIDERRAPVNKLKLAAGLGESGARNLPRPSVLDGSQRRGGRPRHGDGSNVPDMIPASSSIDNAPVSSDTRKRKRFVRVARSTGMSTAISPKPASVRYNDWREVEVPAPEACTPVLPVSAIDSYYDAPKPLHCCWRRWKARPTRATCSRP